MTTLGFRYLPGAPPVIDGYTLHPLMLDFGPSSVDGWLSWVIASELGVEEPELLDRRLRQLVLDGVRVDLTRQEFDVLQYLAERQDRVVTREELLADVWGHSAARGSNVVDATIKLLRGKLGARAAALQTVRGMGYRFIG
jgi:DNA-binding winged helix-turn-helix (wHTH) protein